MTISRHKWYIKAVSSKPNRFYTAISHLFKKEIAHRKSYFLKASIFYGQMSLFNYYSSLEANSVMESVCFRVIMYS